MSGAGLTFFVELERAPLVALFREPALPDLLARHGAALSIGMLDLSRDRARVVRALNKAGVPVTAWLLLDPAQGYWLTADNAEAARERYREILAWSRTHKLQLAGVGLDVEIPRDDTLALLTGGASALAWRLLDRRGRPAIRRALLQYASLVGEIHGDGLRVETYQYPFILDERRAGATLLQRALGVVDIGADREVPMLYESLAPSGWAPALLEAYGADADAIAVGVSGGGEPELMTHFAGRELGLDALVTSLRRARRFTPHLYVFSLEGCVAQGHLESLLAADLSLPVAPARRRGWVRIGRRAAQLLLRAEPFWDILARLRGIAPSSRLGDR